MDTTTTNHTNHHPTMIKKTTKKKTAAKKAAKTMANAIDSIIETVPDQFPEPVSIEPSHEVFDEDDYNPYAPKGFGGGWEEPVDIIMPPDEPEPQPAPVEKPSSPLPVPVGRVAAPVAAPSHKTPPDALTSDALVVQRLINGINHLYGIARLTKGQKGPQPDALHKIQDNIVKAKDLITRLS